MGVIVVRECYEVGYKRKDAQKPVQRRSAAATQIVSNDQKQNLKRRGTVCTQQEE